MPKYKLSKEIPPIYEALKHAFGVDWDGPNPVIITYADTIYCRLDLGSDQIVHECVHILQQEKILPDVWWQRYIEDSEFRLLQEAEAYEEEARYVRHMVRDRNQCYKLLTAMRKKISGPMYGNMCTFEEALILIK